MAHNGQAQGHPDSFLLSGSHLPLLEGTAALYVDRDYRSFISLPKAVHPRTICGVNVKSQDRHSEKDAKNLGGLHFRSAVGQHPEEGRSGASSSSSCGRSRKRALWPGGPGEMRARICCISFQSFYIHTYTRLCPCM